MSKAKVLSFEIHLRWILNFKISPPFWELIYCRCNKTIRFNFKGCMEFLSFSQSRLKNAEKFKIIFEYCPVYKSDVSERIESNGQEDIWEPFFSYKLI